jgi:uncharacterized protein YdeI (YjbR/CyaY-like superfamily)
MDIGRTVHFHDREGWRNWLAKNYDKEKEIWLIFPKKASGKPSVSYEEAVEEALCFGWIDSIAKKSTETVTPNASRLEIQKRLILNPTSKG